jgi:hypothetical protein
MVINSTNEYGGFSVGDFHDSIAASMCDRSSAAAGVPNAMVLQNDVFVTDFCEGAKWESSGSSKNMRKGRSAAYVSRSLFTTHIAF